MITGGAGFIGVNLARTLSDHSAAGELIAFDNFSTGYLDDAEAAGFDKIVTGDIRDLESVASAVSGADAIVHLAAQPGVPSSLRDPHLDMELNVAGTLNVLVAARDAGVERVVLASSAAPLGSAPPPASESVLPQPLSPYGASKLASEAYASAFAGSFGLSTYALRFSNVYGPWSYAKGSVVALWCRQLLAGESITINGDGTQTRDFVHVQDICQAIGLALSHDGQGGLFQLGTGTETSVLDLAQAMAPLFDTTVADSVEFGAALPGEVPRSYTDISKARTELGYEPETNLHEGLATTRQWFIDHWPANGERGSQRQALGG